MLKAPNIASGQCPRRFYVFKSDFSTHTRCMHIRHNMRGRVVFWGVGFRQIFGYEVFVAFFGSEETPNLL